MVAYTVVDIDAALKSDIGQPYAAYLLQVLPQSITMAVLALTIICAFSMGQGCMVSRHGLEGLYPAVANVVARSPLHGSPLRILEMNVSDRCHILPNGSTDIPVLR